MAENQHAEEKYSNERWLRRRHSGHPVLAFIFMLFGLIFLLNNFGWVGWGVWSGLWQFWPIILVLWGLRLVLGRSRISSLVVLLVGLFFVVTAIALSWRDGGWVNNNGWFWSHANQQSQSTQVSGGEFPSLKERDLTIQASVGTLNLNDDRSSNDLLQINQSYFNSSQILNLTKNQTGDLVELTLSGSGDGGWFWNGIHAPQYNLTLGQTELPTSITAQLGAGETKINFANLKLNRFDFELGAGTASVTLANSSLPAQSGQAKVGAGSFNLTVPKDTSLEVTYSVGLGGLTVAGHHLTGNGVYSVNGSNPSAPVPLTITVGTGNAQIIQ